MFSLGHKGGYMAIVKMQIGDPLKLRKVPETVVFLMPNTGQGKGFAGLMAKMFPEEFKKPPRRRLGAVQCRATRQHILFGLVAYANSYVCAPNILRKFLKRLKTLQKKPATVAFVQSGQDIPMHIRFKIMAVLAESDLNIQLIDFQY